MIPPMALLIARLLSYDDEWAERGNLANHFLLALLFLIGAIAPFVTVRNAESASLLALPAVQALFGVLAAASVVAFVISLRSRRAVVSTLCLGFVPLTAFIYAALFLMPIANELASDRPIVRALVAQNVAPEEIALYTAPHLWTRDMPRALERVRYASPESLRSRPATVIVTSRRHAGEIGDVLRGYRKVDQFRMIGKWFDVYRR
jgi:hypothetical protein